MKYKIMSIKRVFFILFLCIVMSGCAIYRYKFFEPVDRDAYKGFGFSSLICTFENWHVTLNFGAYYGSSIADPKDDNFDIWVSASTYDKEVYEYRDTSYRANIQSVRILHGENLENEIDIGKTKLTVYDNGKKIYISNERGVYIPPSIKTVQVIIEVDFIDKENNITTKEYYVPMKLKEKIEPALLTV